MSDRIDHRDRPTFLLAAHRHLPQAAVASQRVDPLGGLATQSVNRFRSVGPHAGAPRGDGSRVTLLGSVRVRPLGTLFFFILEGSIHGASVVLGGIADRLFRGEPALDPRLAW